MWQQQQVGSGSELHQPSHQGETAGLQLVKQGDFLKHGLAIPKVASSPISEPALPSTSHVTSGQVGRNNDGSFGTESLFYCSFTPETRAR